MRGAGLAHQDRRDRRLAGPRVEPRGAQRVLEVSRVFPELVDTLGLVLEQIERRQTGAHHCGRMRRRKKERTRAMIQILDQIAAAAHITAQNAHRLGQGSHLNVHAPMQAKMIHRPAAVAAKDAGRVGVVDHHDRAVPFGNFHQSGQRSDIAVHGEHAVGDQQLAPRLVREIAEQTIGRGHIAMRKNVDLRPREPAAIDDAGVIQRVGDDMILRSENGRNRACVRGETGLKDDA